MTPTTPGAPTTTDRRGECRECGRVMTLKVDGTLRQHRSDIWVNGHPLRCCAGSGALPAPAGGTRAADRDTADG